MIKLKELFDNIPEKSPEDELKEEIYMDDSKFLKRWWNEPVENVNVIFKKMKNLSDRNKSFIKSKNRIGISIYKKEGLWITGKLKYLMDILASKQTNPGFIPDQFKK